MYKIGVAVLCQFPYSGNFYFYYAHDELSYAKQAGVNSLIRVTSISTNGNNNSGNGVGRCQFPYSGNFHFYAAYVPVADTRFICVNSLIRVTSIST